MPTERNTRRPGAARFALAQTWSVVWRIAVFFAAWGTIAAPFMVLGDSQLAEWSKANPTMARLLGDGVVALAILGASWVLMRFAEKRPLREIGFEGPRRFAKSGLGFGTGVAWLAVPLAIVWLGGWMFPNEHPAFPWVAMPTAALALIVNVAAQQLLLCGYLFTMLRVRTGLVPAVSLSALLFVAYHAAGYHGALLPALNVFLTATLFCLARELSGGIWLPLGIHAAWNFLLGPVLGLTVSGRNQLTEGWSAFRLDGPAWATGGEFGIEGSAIVTAASGVIIAIMLSRLRRTRFSSRHRI